MTVLLGERSASGGRYYRGGQLSYRNGLLFGDK